MGRRWRKKRDAAGLSSAVSSSAAVPRTVPLRAANLLQTASAFDADDSRRVGRFYRQASKHGGRGTHGRREARGVPLLSGRSPRGSCCGDYRNKSTFVKPPGCCFDIVRQCLYALVRYAGMSRKLTYTIQLSHSPGALRVERTISAQRHRYATLTLQQSLHPFALLADAYPLLSQCSTSTEPSVKLDPHPKILRQHESAITKDVSCRYTLFN